MTDTRNALATVSHVDLNLYLGDWFEICRLPLKWEDADATDISATYSLEPNGTVKVENRCLDKDGKPERAIGVATPEDASNAKLKVSFLPQYLRWIPFTHGDYWIIRLAADYSVALVGTPDRQHLWLLARHPALPTDVVEDYLAVAHAQGFDLGALITPRQSGQKVPDAFVD